MFCRISELAQHKTSKTVWATTPCEKLVWGNQEPIWPISPAALRAVPSARIQYLARPKRSFSAWDDQWRKEEALSFFKRKQCPSSQYENTVRLSTPRTRTPGSQEAKNRPMWNVAITLRPVPMSALLQQLSRPKPTHPDHLSNRPSAASIVSSASKTTRTSSGTTRLSLPKLKENKICHDLGRPEESIWTISKAAKKASSSVRVEMLSEPKQLSKDYVPPREPEWSPKKPSNLDRKRILFA
ncbi:testicular haploid expressed gene protein-like isoform X3 [Gouania willdenowi]|uniref:testicular haploid expressed gene protein-like isoform X2 n=1 Tax=Gouania willdenowi TaxID=441366 RepID=UPI001056334D|nr:testicular haploid expressed gene protein-like isoform X2 [Gouania willdenowi]XP_028316073.1 testicular haploid expressed gene protein-like isoform X3 [Gouania willdenowi]